LVLEEKRQVIRKSGILEFYDAEEDIEQVGGLQVLKEWLTKRSVDFTEEARAFGLPQPRGVLLLGVQGCGKSLVAKAVSSLWGMPLLRFDVGRVFGSLVGQSEEATRRAIRTAEAIAPAVLWIDEIEKGFAGASAGHLDSGVTARVFGTFLTWMQEKKTAVFIVATANNIRAIPPEMLRKGRFDEVFFVDLPNAEERKTILRVHLLKRAQDPARFDLDRLAEESTGFSGAELEEAVVSGLRDALYDGKRQMTTDDISRSIRQCIPLSVTMKEQIEELRDWATTRARKASVSAESEAIPTYTKRRLEI
jgi:SpoVK/Ycf46/Vps4 family AAA+-type ATPase